MVFGLHGYSKRKKELNNLWKKDNAEWKIW